MVLALEPSEHDFQEFKGTRFIYDKQKIVPDFVASLSKQVSAFANGAGGRIFLGLNDQGCIDGGVPTDLKGGGTRAWLEDVIPAAVEPHLSRFNVFEVLPAEEGSDIRPGRAVYVLDIAASEDAPHQANDYRYYLRIAGKSRPMGNVHIHDILRRTRHPQISVSRIAPYGGAEYVESDPRGPKALICFQLFIANTGRTMAHHVGAEMILPRPLVSGDVRERILAAEEVRLTQRPGQLTFFRYHPTPVFPGQDIFFKRVWVAVHAGNQALIRGGGQLTWRLYADDAPPREGTVALRRYAVVRRALKWLNRPRRKSRKG